MNGEPVVTLVIAGGAEDTRHAIAAALADALAADTGLRCALRSDHDATADVGAAVVMLELDDPRPAGPLIDAAAVTLLVAPPPQRGDAAADRLDADWRRALIGRRVRWAPLPYVAPPLIDAAVRAAIDAVAPTLRAVRTPSAGLLTRLTQRNAAPAARPWRCERCDDPHCEHLATRAAAERRR
jgi:hypothetical protein